MPSLPIYESEDYQMVNTNVHRHGLKRLLAFLLCAVCVFGLIPTQAFAMSPGQKASSWLGDQYVGSDGQHYYSPAPTNFIAYNSDGTTRKLSGFRRQRLPSLYADGFRWRDPFRLLCRERNPLYRFRQFLYFGKRHEQQLSEPAPFRGPTRHYADDDLRLETRRVPSCLWYQCGRL